jgi:hypothetical protein
MLNFILITVCAIFPTYFLPTLLFSRCVRSEFREGEGFGAGSTEIFLNPSAHAHDGGH